MDSKYKTLYNFLSTIKVLCTFTAIVYLIYWFLVFIQLPYIEYASGIFDPATKAIGTFFSWSIVHEGRHIDMTPIIAAGILQLFYFVFDFLADIVEKCDEKYKLGIIAARQLEETLVNRDLKEIFKRKTLRYTKFAILLTLDLQPAVNINLLDKDINLDDIAMKEYVKIVSTMRKKYPACKAITPGKLFILYDNFAMFDDFFTDIIKEIKLICDLNGEKNIVTNFKLAIEAMDDNDKIATVLDLLEEIVTFNYANKAIATSTFNVRYNLNEKTKYMPETMGVSRFFDTTPDGVQISRDFELFCLKTKKQK